MELDHIRESQALSYYQRWVLEIFNAIQIDLYVSKKSLKELLVGLLAIWMMGTLLANSFLIESMYVLRY